MSETSPRRSSVSALLRPRWVRAIAVAFVFGFVLLNVLAYRHARGMLVYDPALTARPPRPEGLSFGEKLRVLARGVQVPRPTVGALPADFDLSDDAPPGRSAGSLRSTRATREIGGEFVGKTIHLTADDGVHLEGWLLEPLDARGTVALFHGYSASRSKLIDEARAIVELGYAAVLVDFRGCGGSDGNVTTLGYLEARDVAATIAWIRERNLPGPIVLYGQSMGAAAVLRAVGVLGVEVDGVVLESVFARMLGAVRNRFAMMHVPSWPAADLLVFWGGLQVGFSGFEHNPVEYAQACNVASLLMHGSTDRHALLGECQAVADALPGRHEMIAFDGAGHESLYRSDRIRWTVAMRGFLASLR